MNSESKNIKIENLPKTENDALKVELVPMPSGDNSWCTKQDYLNDKKRDNIKFCIIIGGLIISIVSATVSYMQMAEARKERTKAEEALEKIKKITKGVVQILALTNAATDKVNLEDLELRDEWYDTKLKQLIRQFNFTEDEEKEIFKFSEKNKEHDVLFRQREISKSTDSTAYKDLGDKIKQNKEETREMYRRDIQNNL